jgi:hypothetical protein
MCNLRMRVASVDCDIQSNTVLPVRLRHPPMEGNPGILRLAPIVTVLVGIRQHWSFYISFGRSVRLLTERSWFGWRSKKDRGLKLDIFLNRLRPD